MKQAILKAFGSISAEYYVKNFFIGAILPFIGWLMPKPWEFWVYPFVIVSCLLYPYSRFIYDKLLGAVERFVTSLLSGNMAFLAKGFTVFSCFCFAILMAPIGLFYLYHYPDEVALED